MGGRRAVYHDRGYDTTAVFLCFLPLSSRPLLPAPDPFTFIFPLQLKRRRVFYVESLLARGFRDTEAVDLVVSSSGAAAAATADDKTAAVPSPRSEIDDGVSLSR